MTIPDETAAGVPAREMDKLVKAHFDFELVVESCGGVNCKQPEYQAMAIPRKYGDRLLLGLANALLLSGHENRVVEIKLMTVRRY